MITNRIAASLTAAIFAMGMIHVSATSISEGSLKLDYDNGKLTLYHNGFAAFNDYIPLPPTTSRVKRQKASRVKTSPRW